MDGRLLLRWQIFNVLAGNSDGHAKNLSLLHSPKDETRLAPFYDLVCTRAIERIDFHLAFEVGGQRNPNAITREHWEELGRRCDLRAQFVVNLVREMADDLQQRIGLEREAFERLYGPYPALQRIEKVVLQQCRRAMKR
ncbi:MAG: HipA domain-containing protein [Xanthomonadaceae bacterium]|nr:HipA domain-containing protein [Xanthomonadaceae bacterium]